VRRRDSTPAPCLRVARARAVWRVQASSLACASSFKSRVCVKLGCSPPSLLYVSLECLAGRHLRPHISDKGVRCRLPAALLFEQAPASPQACPCGPGSTEPDQSGGWTLSTCRHALPHARLPSSLPACTFPLEGRRAARARLTSLLASLRCSPHFVARLTLLLASLWCSRRLPPPLSSVYSDFSLCQWVCGRLALAPTSSLNPEPCPWVPPPVSVYEGFTAR
jgi:hypothetical protein